jgi:hypothetical protein
MACQITLTDEDYAALAATATRASASIEELVHQAVASSCPRLKQIGAYRFPTGARMPRERREAKERLARKIGLSSEIDIDDRGPR